MGIFNIVRSHSGSGSRQIFEFEASLVYRVKSGIARVIQKNSVSKKKQKKTKTQTKPNTTTTNKNHY
jgi:23S rRNA A2030 N6-methylase RlmJ